MDKADPYYLDARDKALAAAGRLDKKHRKFQTPDGVEFFITWKTPLRLYLLIIRRMLPGEADATSFSFQRNGRVNLGGARGVPLREAIASQHEPWASRSEVEELASQLRLAEPR
jgi:hypothetical protein